MNISYSQILELWHLKILVYALRKTSWIRQTLLTPILVFLVAIGLSHYEKNIVLISLCASVIYITLAILVFRKIEKAKQRCLKGEPAYQLVAFLFYTFDLLTMTMFVLSSFLMAISSSQDIMFDAFTLHWLMLLLVLTVVLTIFFSSMSLNRKSLSRINNNGVDLYLPLILSALNLIPSFFVFISVVLVQSGEVDLLRIMMAMLSFVCSMILLPYVVLGYCEFFVMLFRRWPRVLKSGSDFVFLDEQ